MHSLFIMYILIYFYAKVYMHQENTLLYASEVVEGYKNTATSKDTKPSKILFICFH